MKNIRKLAPLAGLFVTIAITACSSNNNNGTAAEVATPIPVVPAPVPSSTNSFIDFLLALVNDETSEPYIIGEGFAVPADETGVPLPLI